MLFRVSALIVLASLAWSQPRPLQVPTVLSNKLKSFEPSASLYLPDLDLFLIASDDTTKRNDPWLFFANPQGQVYPQPVVIQGVSAITDIESLSQDESGALYILCSQGLNKKGKDLKERNLFIRAERQGMNIRAVQVIELRPLILKAILSSDQPELAPLKSDLVEELDIESHFILRDELYVGLKGPQARNGQAWVLNLGSVKKLFQNRVVDQVRVALKFDFSALSRHPDLLSEMLILGDNLFLATTSESGEGRLWIYNLKVQKLQIVRSYKEFRPEGLAFNSHRRELVIFFDQGEETALFSTEPLQIRRY